MLHYFAFTQQVWQAAKQIPRGKVATYSQIAEYLGRPGAARAVGNALNKNPFLVKIPCHRIVCADGRVGGYKKGKEIKYRLLIQEGIKIKKGRIVGWPAPQIKLK
ncbi:MGMT family protein [Candidatus Parcubacteria bacterium]|nr:MAG: MGMT family protein [Candidatus Parcubacteria bacterium]